MKRLTELERQQARELLETACRETSNQAVAQRLGYSRGAISCVRRGVYQGEPDQVLAHALEVFGRIPCPYLRRDLTQDECRAVWGGPTPSHDPAALAHRRACRVCIHKQKEGA